MSIKDKTIVFTGALSITRKMASAQAIAAGAKVGIAVSRNTDIVVAGDAAGGKLDTAYAKGVSIWTEAQFVKACGKAAGPACDHLGAGVTRHHSPPAPAMPAPTVHIPPPTVLGGGGGGGPNIQWQWWDFQKSTWVSFTPADSGVLEAKFADLLFDFDLTTELSFNLKHKNTYNFNLADKKQKNLTTGKVRKLQRLVDGTESYRRTKPVPEVKKRNRDVDDDEDGADDDDGFGVDYTVWDGAVDASCDNKVSSLHVKSTEKALGGKRLPTSYVKLVSNFGQNGGGLVKRWFPRPDDEDDDEGDDDENEKLWNTAVICGISDDHENFGLSAWQEGVGGTDSGYPKKGYVYFADTDEEDAMWALDYTKCGSKGDPEVVRVAAAGGHAVTWIARNFQSFLDQLVEGDY